MSDQPVTLTRTELDRMLDAAAEKGARAALAKLGLADDHAATDVRELRDLLDAWRQARRTIWQTVAREVTRLLLIVVVAGVAWHLSSGGR